MSIIIPSTESLICVSIKIVAPSSSLWIASSEPIAPPRKSTTNATVAVLNGNTLTAPAMVPTPNNRGIPAAMSAASRRITCEAGSSSRLKREETLPSGGGTGVGDGGGDKRNGGRCGGRNGCGEDGRGGSGESGGAEGTGGRGGVSGGGGAGEGGGGCHQVPRLPTPCKSRADVPCCGAMASSEPPDVNHPSGWPADSDRVRSNVPGA
eukprot:scaffold57061_cov31-Tisochrysis_lutea.AAC.1